LDPVQTISTLPDDFDGSSSCADIHVSADGKFVYGSNRGHDSIVIYAVDPSSGQLTYVGHESTRGQSPRNFGIDPTGTYLLAANHGSGNIFVFKIDSETGTLDYTGYSAEVPTPVCLKMVQIED
jgi:6-phosphogluconolactonase